MKKLISLLIVMCMVISCAAAAAYAEETEEKAEDYSSLFFEYMKEYVQKEENGEGLVKPTYKLLGDTSYGYHVAFCYYLTNISSEEAEAKGAPRREINGYVIKSFDNCYHKPSDFGMYFFNSENCYTLEEVFEKKIVPLDKAARIINRYYNEYHTFAFKKPESFGENSEEFFTHMREYLNSNPDNSGLVYSTYRHLGDTKNGFHIAYCEYYWGDDYDREYFKRSGRVKIGDYLLCGSAYRYLPSALGVYCFNDERCFTIESVFSSAADTDKSAEPGMKEVPLDEVIRILDETDKVHVYHKDELPENSELAVYFKDETIHEIFAKYLKTKHNYTDFSSCSVYGKYKDYYIFFGAEEICLDASHTEIIDGYAVISDSIFHPYALGIYALDGEKVYTLKEAIDAKLFRMSEIADILYVKPVGDANRDGNVDMTDVTRLQKVLAQLEKMYMDEYITPLVDLDGDYELTMHDVVLIQRKIAKL